MKNRFVSWKKRHPLAARNTCTISGMLIATVAFIGALAAIQIFYLNPRSLARRYFSLDAATGCIELLGMYKDGHIELLERFTESTGGANFLLDPMYAGAAPMATSYDPATLYEKCKAGTDPDLFEYNCGIKHGDFGFVKLEPSTGIMTVEFRNGVQSWVNQQGVIASAAFNPDGTACVAFYAHNPDTTSPS